MSSPGMTGSLSMRPPRLRANRCSPIVSVAAPSGAVKKPWTEELQIEAEARQAAEAEAARLREQLRDRNATALFLHRIVADLPEAKQKMLETLHSSNEALRGRKVLVVDDDARNIFALATLLENEEMEVVTATNGRQPST